MRILIIDNFDSFVYNLYQYVGELNPDVIVKRNNIALKEVKKIAPDKIIISPGPGRPEDAGICVEIIKELGEKIPILGVCLGHQAIGYAFGAKITNAKELMHGKTCLVEHDGKSIFNEVKNPFIATRYHSLVISAEDIPKELVVTAKCREDGEIMGARHRKYPIEGVQFHPESILTQEGKKIIANFLSL